MGRSELRKREMPPKLCLGWGRIMTLVSIFSIGIGFAGGYGLREWISRRRRAIAREEWLRRYDEKQRKLYNQISTSLEP